MFPLTVRNLCTSGARKPQVVLPEPDITKIASYPVLPDMLVEIFCKNEGGDNMYGGYSYRPEPQNEYLVDPALWSKLDKTITVNIPWKYVSRRGCDTVESDAFEGYFFPIPVIKLDIPDGTYVIYGVRYSKLAVNYINGLREGKAFNLDNNNNILESTIYSAGSPVRETKANGDVINYKNGLLNGEYIVHTRQGRIVDKLNNVNGYVAGPFIDYNGMGDANNTIIGQVQEGTGIRAGYWNVAAYGEGWVRNSFYYKGSWKQFYPDNHPQTWRRGKVIAHFNYDDNGLLDGVSYATFEDKDQCIKAYPKFKCQIINHSNVPAPPGDDLLRYGVIRYFIGGKELTKEQFDAWFDDMYNLLLQELPEVLALMVYDYAVDPASTEEPMVTPEPQT